MVSWAVGVWVESMEKQVWEIPTLIRKAKIEHFISERELTYIYHLKFFGEYVVCVSQCVLLINKGPNKNVLLFWPPELMI